MDFMTAVKTCLIEKYVTFSGRGRRSEYWFWVLFGVIGSIILGVFDDVLGMKLLGPLFSLATFLPAISAAVRRLHDLDKSGWWLLILLIPIVGTIIFIVWAATKGTTGDNRFGPDPLAGDVVGA